MAAPVGGQIFSEILPYLEVSQGNAEEVEEKEEVEMPDLLGKSLEEAKKIVKESGLELVIENEIEEMELANPFVKSQIPSAGIKVVKGNKAYVQLGIGTNVP